MLKKQVINNQQLIELEFYQKEFELEVQSFKLSDEQEQFTALPTDALEKCLVEPERKPIVIIVDGVPVGFFVLHTGEALRPFTDNPNAVLVRALSINQIHQGKGYAKKAMTDLPAFVMKNFTTINEIVLAVNANNSIAKEMYLKVGFVDKGLRREGRIGMQYMLHYDLV